MLMTKETIIALYKESQTNGMDPVREIKSLAKSNEVKATVIKNILIDAGCDVPEHIPTGPIKKEIEAADPVPGEVGYRERKAAVINEDFEAAVQDMIEEKSPTTRQELKERLASIPEPVVRHLSITLEALRAEAESLEKEAAAKRDEYETIKAFLGR